MGFFALFAIACISAGLSASVATAKGWSGLSWLVAGFVFGPLGLIAAAGMPDRKTRHYLFELSKQQGVSSEALEPRESEFTTVAVAAQTSFKTDPLTTDEQLWQLILDCLPDHMREQADRGKSELKRNSSRMIIRSSDGYYLIEVQRLHATSDGLVSWKLVNRP